MKIDMHVHTRWSNDAVTKITDIEKFYMETGIIPVICDHDTTKGWEEMQMKGLPFIRGEEINTGEGEVIGLFLTEEIPKGLGFYETLDMIRKQGALSYCPHPFDWFRKGVEKEDKIKNCDIIEVFNSRCLYQGPNKKADSLADKYGMLKGVGSDAHFPFEMGHAYVEFEPDIDLKNPKQFIKALSDEHTKLYKKKTTIFVHGPTRAIKLFKKLGLLR